jgi:hypothetical protein
MHPKFHMEKNPPPPPPHLAIQGVGQLVELMYGKTLVEKYVDPINHIFIFNINNVPIENTLVDLRAAIKTMTIMTM